MEIDQDKGYQTCGVGSCDFTSEAFLVLEDLKEVTELSVLLLGAGVGGGVRTSDPAQRAASAAWHIMSPLEYVGRWNRRRDKKEMVGARWCRAGEAEGSRGRKLKELKYGSGNR